MNNEPAYELLRKTLVAGQLPAMPHSALSILKLENDITKVKIDDLIRPIEADPGLAVQVLKFLNSSAFGFQSTITNIRQGVALVGIRTIKNFVLWKAVFSLLPKGKSGAFDVGMLWQDSLRRGMFARFMLLEKKRGDAEMAFAGALLQDMAIPLLMKLKGANYTSVLEMLSKDRTQRLSALEERHFQWNHADAALILGQHWKLPEILVDLTSNHLKAEEAVAEYSKHPERAVVAVSALLPAVAYDDWPDRERFIACFAKCFPDRAQYYVSLFERVDVEFEQYAALLQIPQPKHTLSVHLEQPEQEEPGQEPPASAPPA